MTGGPAQACVELAYSCHCHPACFGNKHCSCLWQERPLLALWLVLGSPSSLQSLMPQARDTHFPRFTPVAGTTFHSHTGTCRSPQVPGTEFLRRAHSWDSASSYVERNIREFLIRRCKKMRQTMAIRCRTKLDEWHYFMDNWNPLCPFCLSYLCSSFLSLPLGLHID